MYSYDDRLRAVKLYIQYSKSATDTIRELGYPSRKNLRRWYRSQIETGGGGCRSGLLRSRRSQVRILPGAPYKPRLTSPLIPSRSLSVTRS